MFLGSRESIVFCQNYLGIGAKARKRRIVDIETNWMLQHDFGTNMYFVVGSFEQALNGAAPDLTSSGMDVWGSCGTALRKVRSGLAAVLSSGGISDSQRMPVGALQSESRHRRYLAYLAHQAAAPSCRPRYPLGFAARTT